MNANYIPEEQLVGPFSSDVFPSKSGIYIRKYNNGDRYYAYYDTSEKWFSFTTTIPAALKNKNNDIRTECPNLPWYGITEEFHKELSK